MAQLIVETKAGKVYEPGHLMVEITIKSVSSCCRSDDEVKLLKEPFIVDLFVAPEDVESYLRIFNEGG